MTTGWFYLYAESRELEYMAILKQTNSTKQKPTDCFQDCETMAVTNGKQGHSILVEAVVYSYTLQSYDPVTCY